MVRQTPGWPSLPVATSNGHGIWIVPSGGASEFIPDWAASARERGLGRGGFNG
jgi:hypothetical protein